MDVSNNVAPISLDPTTDKMATDMDMEIDYSEQDPEVARLQAEAARFDAVHPTSICVRNWRHD